LILLTSENLSQNSSHDLSTAGLWQIGHNEDSLWRRKRTNALSDLQDEILPQLVIDLIAVLDGYKRVDCLSGQLIIDTDNCSFSNSVMLDQGCFDFGG
jgi:hypothetical protein